MRICLSIGTLILASLVVLPAFGQTGSSYELALQELKGMLTDSIPMNFKRAVFLTENAYLGNQLSYEKYDQNIKFLASLCRNMASQQPILYREPDKDDVNKYAAVYRLMTDSITFQINDSTSFSTEPFRYDFDDFWGEKNWGKMFVTKLLETHSGNCHSLPFLYKILCEELGTKAYLAMAPNHLYIKLWAKKTGWFNTELTSRYFPTDAWVMVSGYIPVSAVQNRIYMDTLSQKQSIALCLIDLAKGYEKRNPFDLNFLDKSADLALQYHPKYVNALILKAETTKKRFEKLMSLSNASYPSDIFSNSEAASIFASMESQYLNIHQLGYRMMPKEMYLKWLRDLSREKEKYQNKEAASSLIQQKK